MNPRKNAMNWGEDENDAEDELLTRERAAEHVLHAIADGAEDLLTHGVTDLLGLDCRLTVSASRPASWDFCGHEFAFSGAAAAIGVAAIMTAPLEAPTLLVGSAVFGASHALSAIMEGPWEVRRRIAAQRFKQAFGFHRELLKWSIIPAATRFWFLAEGDTVLELVLKAKRGVLGMGDNAETTTRLLRRVLSLWPGAPNVQMRRLACAIVKAQTDMGLPADSPTLAPALQVLSDLKQQMRVGSSDAAVDSGSLLSWAHGTPAAISDRQQCTVCLERPRTHALTPCGHRCLCERCANLAALEYACPICRARATGLLRIYDP